MTIDEERPPLTLPQYRAVKYSIRDLGQGRWRWALHRRRSEVGGFLREITSGEVVKIEVTPETLHGKLEP